MHPPLRAITVAVVFHFMAAPVRAEVKPHALFTDGAVLQRGRPVPVWGTADPAEAVEVTLAGDGKPLATASAVADQDGRWRCDLPALPEAGGTYALRVKGKSNEVAVENVLVGEVWLCSGQSNMQWPLKASRGGKAAVRGAADPRLRLFSVANGPAMTPERDARGSWAACSPESAEAFSAVGYYFGRYLRQKLGVPVGLIQNAWGGTPAEAWTSRKVLESDPALAHLISNFEQRLREYPQQLESFAAAAERYMESAEKARAEGKPASKAPKKPQDPKTFPNNAPFLLYNSRVATIIPFAIRGAIWYQGEANAGPGRAEEYATLFPALIRNWRHDWGQGDFPFLFVQLAPFMEIVDEPADTPWAWLREAQRQTSLTVPNTAMAVITDVGDEDDVHPKQKRPVGERLAAAALALAYGRDVPHAGPVYDSMRVENGAAVVSFKNAAQGLEVRGEEVTGFTIAGTDGKFVPAKAVIQGNEVVVSSPEVGEPAAVRFGWANFPVVNLWGKDRLPASPFRTDDFPPPWKQPKK
jgi:sialate O-acetylesterase